MKSEKLDIELAKLSDEIALDKLGTYPFHSRVAMWALTILIARTLIEILRNLENGSSRKD